MGGMAGFESQGGISDQSAPAKLNDVEVSEAFQDPVKIQATVLWSLERVQAEFPQLVARIARSLGGLARGKPVHILSESLQKLGIVVKASLSALNDGLEADVLRTTSNRLLVYKFFEGSKARGEPPLQILLGSGWHSVSWRQTSR